MSIFDSVLENIEADLKPEIFFYGCNIVPRTEMIPIRSKTIASKQNVRTFKKETSVFKLWHEEKVANIKKQVEMDCSLWKIAKFITE